VRILCEATSGEHGPRLPNWGSRFSRWADTLLWDLGAHRMHSLELEVEVTASFDAAWMVGHGDMELEVEVVQTSHGTRRVEATVAPSE
jgi:hypothetical protein